MEGCACGGGEGRLGGLGASVVEGGGGGGEVVDGELLLPEAADEEDAPPCKGAKRYNTNKQGAVDKT